jgi:hypothetical protein
MNVFIVFAVVARLACHRTGEIHAVDDGRDPAVLRGL